jgi:hypothetical protein
VLEANNPVPLQLRKLLQVVQDLLAGDEDRSGGVNLQPQPLQLQHTLGAKRVWHGGALRPGGGISEPVVQVKLVLGVHSFSFSETPKGAS